MCSFCIGLVREYTRMLDMRLAHVLVSTDTAGCTQHNSCCEAWCIIEARKTIGFDQISTIKCKTTFRAQCVFRYWNFCRCVTQRTDLGSETVSDGLPTIAFAALFIPSPSRNAVWCLPSLTAARAVNLSPPSVVAAWLIFWRRGQTQQSAKCREWPAGVLRAERAVAHGVPGRCHLLHSAHPETHSETDPLSSRQCALISKQRPWIRL